MKPYIIANGRGRLILNICRGQLAVTNELDGAGVTQFLDRKQTAELLAILPVMAKGVE